MASTRLKIETASGFCEVTSAVFKYLIYFILSQALLVIIIFFTCKETTILLFENAVADKRKILNVILGEN